MKILDFRPRIFVSFRNTIEGFLAFIRTRWTEDARPMENDGSISSRRCGAASALCILLSALESPRIARFDTVEDVMIQREDFVEFLVGSRFPSVASDVPLHHAVIRSEKGCRS